MGVNNRPSVHEVDSVIKSKDMLYLLREKTIANMIESGISVNDSVNATIAAMRSPHIGYVNPDLVALCSYIVATGKNGLVPEGEEEIFDQEIGSDGRY